MRILVIFNFLYGMGFAEIGAFSLCGNAHREAFCEGHFKIAWIGLQDPDTQHIVPFSWDGEMADLPRFTQISAAGSAQQDDIVSRAIGSKLPVVCNELRTFPKLPVQTLKIDRSFVSAMLDDPSTAIHNRYVHHRTEKPVLTAHNPLWLADTGRNAKGKQNPRGGLDSAPCSRTDSHLAAGSML